MLPLPRTCKSLSFAGAFYALGAELSKDLEWVFSCWADLNRYVRDVTSKFLPVPLRFLVERQGKQQLPSLTTLCSFKVKSLRPLKTPFDTPRFIKLGGFIISTPKCQHAHKWSALEVSPSCSEININLQPVQVSRE
jgi:hypothetical protein